MKDFIRDRLRLLLEHKKTTHTGVSKPDYGGRGDRVYYFNYGTLEDFKNYLRVLDAEIFSKLTDKEKGQLSGVDTNIEYGNFEFKIRKNSVGGPNIQGAESNPKIKNIGVKDSQTGNTRFIRKKGALGFKETYLNHMLELTLITGTKLLFKIVGEFGDDKIFFTICSSDSVLSTFYKNNIYMVDLPSLSGKDIKTKYAHIKNVNDIKNYTQNLETWKPYTFKLSDTINVFKDNNTYDCNLTSIIRAFKELPIPFIPINNYLSKIGRKPTKQYYAYLNMLYQDKDLIIDFIDKEVGYLDDKAKDISKEKTPEKHKYKHDKLKDEIKNKEKRMGTVMKMEVDEKEIRAEIADIRAKKIKAHNSKDRERARQLGKIQKQLEKKLNDL